MPDNKAQLLAKLRSLGLTNDEARVYMELLKEPNTYLRISTITGIGRSKVYRLVDQLRKRSLVAFRSDDRGNFVAATSPASLDIGLTAQEEQLKQQRITLTEIMPALNSLMMPDTSTFTVCTYEGDEGMKQMQWHELKTEGELLVLGNVTVEEIVGSRRWSEKFRAKTAAAGYLTREIINRPYNTPAFTNNQDFLQRYIPRTIPAALLPMQTPMVMYNHTVATYQLQDDRKVGVEIISQAFAQTMRHIFEHYWELGSQYTTPGK